MPDDSEIRRLNAEFSHLRHLSVTPALRKRKSHLSNIWIFDSPKNQERIVIEGDVAFMHLVLLEGDIHVDRYNANPAPITTIIDAEVRQTILDAIVYFRRGHYEWWEFKRATDATPHRQGRAKPQLSAQAQAAAIAGAPYRIKTDTDLVGKGVLFDNWLLLCAAMNRVRGISLHHEMDIIKHRLDAHGQVTFGSLLSEQNIDIALMLAAVANFLQRGLISCELEMELFGIASRIRGARDE